jgi:hypothetical protein
MPNLSRFLFTLAALLCSLPAIAQQPAAAGGSNNQQAVPAFNEWIDEFNGPALDADKWERFTFEGGSGGKVKVEEGQLRMRGQGGTGGSRSGVRTKQAFTGDRFIVEGVVAKVGPPMPEPDQPNSHPLGNAVLTILFDGSGRNRVEWILTSEGTFEAWSIVDGRGERLDDRKLGTKEKTPALGIVRRGDEFLFMLNGQEGMRRTIKNLPRTFHVMLYGFGSSENNWDAVRIVTPK